MIEGTSRVDVAAGTVAVGKEVGGTGVSVAGVVGETTVGDAGSVKVALGEALGVTGVRLAIGVMDGVTDAVGVINSGLPNSRHPRSGAAPVNPVIGLGGISSPLFATYCVTPLSMAGEPGCSSKPLKSSSTVPHVPSGPGFGAA